MERSSLARGDTIQTEFDWPSWQGGSGGGGWAGSVFASLSSWVSSLTLQDAVATGVTSAIGFGLFVYGPGKWRALGAAIVAIPEPVLLALYSTGFDFIAPSTSSSVNLYMWTGPGFVQYA